MEGNTLHVVLFRLGTDLKIKKWTGYHDFLVLFLVRLYIPKDLEDLKCSTYFSTNGTEDEDGRYTLNLESKWDSDFCC